MSLAYDVFVNDPPPQDGFLPNGEPKRFSPTASTLIYGDEDAVLTDLGLTEDQARVLGDWVASKGRNLTDIYITHGHGDHWFAAGPLAARFGARVVAADGVIAQMRGNVAARPLLWDKLYAGLIPPSPVTAATVPDLGLVVAGDSIYNGVHMYTGQSAAVGGFGPWRAAIDRVEALAPRHIVCGHQDSRLDDDASRTIAQTRQYLEDAEELLKTEDTAVDFFNAKTEPYPDHLSRYVLW